MNQIEHLTSGDLISIELIKEAGLFFCRLMNHQRNYPESAATLSLVAMPYIVVIEHDAIPYLNKSFNTNLKQVDTRLSLIRHLTKTLSSGHLDYREYSIQAAAILQQLQSHFKSHKGILAPMLNAFQPDVGVCFYRGMPVYATYTVAHLLSAGGRGIILDDEGRYPREIGYAAGTAAAFLYSFAKSCIKDEAAFDAPEFVVTANDYHFDRISSTIAARCFGDKILFFFLTDLLIQLQSAKALYLGKLFGSLLWLKFATINLFNVCEAVKAFSSYARGNNGKQYPQDFLDDISLLVSRDERKKIEKTKRLRNSMIHYDFKPEMMSNAANRTTPDGLIEASINALMHMSTDEYLHFLDSTIEAIAKRISNLISFPLYSERNNVL